MSFSAFLGAAACASAHAQLGTGWWSWEISADEGATWNGGLTTVDWSQSSVLVRAVAGWSPDAGTAMGPAQFDGVWRSLDSGGLADSIDTIRVRPGYSFRGSTYVTTRFGSEIKIDEPRDTSPPGLGIGAVAIGQVPPLGLIEHLNPVDMFHFTVRLDGTPGDRLMTALFREHGPDRYMQVYWYEPPQWIANFPLMTHSTATLRVLPCPADFNRDGLADFLDYLDFADAFSRDDPAADFNGDNHVDFFDYLRFVEALDGGC